MRDTREGGGRTKRMAALRFLIALTLTAGALLPAAAAAGVSVSGLRLGLDPDVTASEDVFPPGTETVYAVFDYADADDDDISLSVLARSGMRVFWAAGRYSGSGQVKVAIDGTTVTRSLAGELQATAEAARADARRAVTDSFGLQEYLLAAHGGLLRMGYAHQLLVGARLRPADTLTLERLAVAIADGKRLARQAIALPADEEAAKRQLAAQLDVPLAVAVREAVRLVESVQTLDALPIPESGPGLRAAYTVQVEVTGMPAATLEFVVAEIPALFLPWCIRSP